MDFKKFFQEVVEWMEQSNEKIKQYSIKSDEYWDWAVKSSGELCEKFESHPLAIAQMTMLMNYLENIYKNLEEA